MSSNKSTPTSGVMISKIKCSTNVVPGSVISWNSTNSKVSPEVLKISTKWIRSNHLSPPRKRRQSESPWNKKPRTKKRKRIRKKLEKKAKRVKSLRRTSSWLPEQLRDRVKRSRNSRRSNYSHHKKKNNNYFSSPHQLIIIL